MIITKNEYRTLKQIDKTTYMEEPNGAMYTYLSDNELILMSGHLDEPEDFFVQMTQKGKIILKDYKKTKINNILKEIRNWGTLLIALISLIISIVCYFK